MLSNGKNLQDVADLVNGTGELKIRLRELQGTENWVKAGTNTVYITKTSLGSPKTIGYGLVSDMARGQKSWITPNLMFTISTDEVYFGRGADSADVETWKSYLATRYANGNPLKFAYERSTPLTFTSLFLSASSTADELTAMPADAIPLSEIQFADNNWSIEEAIYDAPEADANGVITPTAVTGQMRIQYSLDAAEQIDTLQKEYAALESRVTALENR